MRNATHEESKERLQTYTARFIKFEKDCLTNKQKLRDRKHALDPLELKKQYALFERKFRKSISKTQAFITNIAIRGKKYMESEHFEKLLQIFYRVTPGFSSKAIYTLYAKITDPNTLKIIHDSIQSNRAPDRPDPIQNMIDSAMQEIIATTLANLVHPDNPSTSKEYNESLSIIRNVLSLDTQAYFHEYTYFFDHADEPELADIKKSLRVPLTAALASKGAPHGGAPLITQPVEVPSSAAASALLSLFDTNKPAASYSQKRGAPSLDTRSEPTDKRRCLGADARP